MSTPWQRSGLLRANLTVASGTALSRITGLIRIIVFGAIIGQTALADAYDAANNAPNVIYELLLGGILAASLVPMFTRHLIDNDDNAVNAICSTALAALGVITTLSVVLAPLIFRLFSLYPSDEIDVDLFRSTGSALARLLLLQIFFYGVTALATAILNARKLFFAAAWTPVLANVVTIFSLLMIRVVSSTDQPGLSDVSTNRDLQWLLGMGSTSGIIVMAIGMIIALRKAGIRPRWNFDIRHPAVRQLGRLSVWAIGYVVANQIALIVVKNLASPGSGNVDAYSKAYTFFSLPHGLLAVSIATTFAPDLARAAASSDRGVFSQKLTSGIRLTALVTIPASVGMYLLAKPLVAMFLQHGNFDGDATDNTAQALTAMTLGLVGFSIYLFAMRGFYADNDTRTPFFINLLENTINIVLALILVERFEVFGLGLAFALAYLASAVVALFRLQSKNSNFRVAILIKGILPMIFSGCVMGIVLVAISESWSEDSVGTTALVQVVSGVVIGISCYVAMLYIFRVSEIRQLLGRNKNN